MSKDYAGNKHIPYQTDLDVDQASPAIDGPLIVPDEKNEGEFKLNKDALDQIKDADKKR
jgi:hypothetical protein